MTIRVVRSPVSRFETVPATCPSRPRRPLAHLPALDGLRAIAVLLVFWVHFPFIADSALGKAVWSLGQTIRAGYLGVDLFFVLSGFLITRILLDERERSGTVSLRVFYTRRALRIFPIYYLCVAVYAINFTFDGPQLASLLTYTINYYHPFHPTPNAMEHAWSLAVEEQFYLVWPALVMLVPIGLGRRMCGVVIPAAAMAAAFLIALAVETAIAGNLIYMASVTRMMSLSLGAALAYREITATPMPPWQPYVMLLGGVTLLGLDHTARAVGLISPGGWYWTIALLGYALLSTGAVALLVTAGDRLARAARAVMATAPLRYVGRISYGLYLYHVLLLFLLGLAPFQMATSGASAGQLAFALAATFATAAISYHVIEAPLLRLKDRFGPRDAPPSYVD